MFLLSMAELAKKTLKTERYDIKMANIKIEEQEKYLKKMDIEASDLRESSDHYKVKTKIREP